MPIQIGRRINPALVQRSLREVGRIRAGYSDEVEGKTWRKPCRSDTLILTSLQQRVIVAAAARWGGEPEPWTPQGSNVPTWRVVTDTAEIPAILPQGNPLSTMFETWNGGKCVRRCDGVVEEKVDGRDKPCLCAAQFGPQWYEREPTSPPTTCKITGRLNVYLEELGDFGYWRIDVHSFYAVTEMSGLVDWVKARLGPEPSIRIRVAIEQRARGKARYPVVAIRLADDTAIQILSGQTPQLTVGELPDRRALTATAHVDDAEGDGGQRALTAAAAAPPPRVDDEAGAPDWGARFDAAPDKTTLGGLWRDCVAAAAMTAVLEARWKAAAARLTSTPPPPAAETPPGYDPEPPIDAETEPDRLTLWTQILTLAGQQGWTDEDVARHMQAKTGYEPTAADGWAMEIFLNAMKAGVL
jgi:hypothetical protein